ncbi:hypothetical protein DERF_008528 [Dermatophagoides farinae]|uniref:Chitin-binding type-2 domain-containing protein n=1 Tax=Dermatophagoides farinae TaxID=6954 RepID=A0A922I5W5_DERFA|nr:hypothetical protein DERF_008528 [Dermatophagoides farinae]
MAMMMMKLLLCHIAFMVILFVLFVQSKSNNDGYDDKSIDLIDPNCRCCAGGGGDGGGNGRPSGRYCGHTLNQQCPGALCTNDSIYYCFSTYDVAQRVRTCPPFNVDTKNCLQISPGSSRCSNQ